jgi:aminoglycoside 2''-phosphotransferase
MTDVAKGKVDLAALVARIRDAFPDLAFEHARLNDLGEDHAVVMLDESWVFRFPRGPEAASFASGERRVLEALARSSNLPVPRYERVAPDASFAGYRKIEGEELTEARFAALPRPAQERIIDELGVFLAALHALPLSLTADAEHIQWNGEVQARRYAGRRDDYAGILPAPLLPRADAFFAALAAQPEPPALRMVHNDFTLDHILLAPGGDRLAGIIDFTDAGPDDPAYDFTFFWAYADWAPDRALAAYSAGAEHADLRERSRWQFARYRIEQLWWEARGFRHYPVPKLLGELPGLLDALGV